MESGSGWSFAKIRRKLSPGTQYTSGRGFAKVGTRPTKPGCPEMAIRSPLFFPKMSSLPNWCGAPGQNGSSCRGLLVFYLAYGLARATTLTVGLGAIVLFRGFTLLLPPLPGLWLARKELRDAP